jgi:hypothetical protein
MKADANFIKISGGCNLMMKKAFGYLKHGGGN